VPLKEIITYVSIFVPLIPILFGIRKRTLLWYYIISGLLSDWIIVFLLGGHQERMLVGNLFVLVEFVFIYKYYQQKIGNKNKWLLYANIPIFLFATVKMFEAGSSFAMQNAIMKFNWMGAAMLCLSYFSFSLAGFKQIIQEQKITHIEKSAFFLINTTFLIYFATVFMVLLFTNYLIDHDKITWFWRFFEIMNILKYLVLARAFMLKD
jgi:hypothetical protein